MTTRRGATIDTATLPTLPAVARRNAPVWLTAFFGPAAPRCIRIEGKVQVGRDAECTLAIEDSGASRAHCEIAPSAGGVIVRDLGSHNGTFVDGARTEEIEVGDGATVRVGQSLLRIHWANERWAPDSEGSLVGGSAIATVRRQLSLVAPTRLAVLLLGETGTGKDVLARAIHAGSGRTGELVCVNCAALSESLAEAELFGHTRAAFTGAAAPRKGLFAAADGGTLFLDEVGELSPAMQAKLLRVIEDGEVRPVGAERATRIDARIVSATNRDLGARIQSGEFRSDLFARLAGVEVRLPPLRARPEDLPALSSFLLERAGGRAPSIDCDAMEAMALYDWPMNVRELDAVLRNAALAGHDPIGFADLPEAIRAPLGNARAQRGTTRPRASRPEPEPIGEGEEARARLEDSLVRHRGNVRKVSKDLSLSRGHVYRLLARFGLDPESYRNPG